MKTAKAQIPVDSFVYSVGSGIYDLGQRSALRKKLIQNVCDGVCNVIVTENNAYGDEYIHYLCEMLQYADFLCANAETVSAIEACVFYKPKDLSDLSITSRFAPLTVIYDLPENIVSQDTEPSEPDRKRWIFFDVGFTLVNEMPVHNKRIDDTLERIKQKTGSSISREEFMKEVHRCAGAGKSPYVGACRSYGIEHTEYTNEGETVFPDSISTLSELKKSGFNIGIIASQPSGTVGRLRNYGLLGNIDAVFSTAEIGYDKPDKRLFQIALESCGVEPGNAFMVGDRIDNDVFPAKAIGMKTIRIHQGFYIEIVPAGDEETPDYSIEQIKDILTLDLN